MTNFEFNNSVFNINILKLIGQREGNNISVGTTRRFNKIAKILEKVREEEEETRKIATEKGLSEEEIVAEVELYNKEEFKHYFEPILASFLDGLKEEVITVHLDGKEIKVSPTSIIELLIDRGIIVE